MSTTNTYITSSKNNGKKKSFNDIYQHIDDFTVFCSLFFIFLETFLLSFFPFWTFFLPLYAIKLPGLNKMMLKIPRGLKSLGCSYTLRYYSKMLKIYTKKTFFPFLQTEEELKN